MTRTKEMCKIIKKIDCKETKLVISATILRNLTHLQIAEISNIRKGTGLITNIKKLDIRRNRDPNKKR